MNFPVRLQLLPSRRLRAALVIMHLTALAAALVQDFLPPLLVLPPLALSFVLVWRSAGRETRLSLQEDGGLLCHGAGDEALPGKILSGTAFSWLVVLRIRLEGEGKARRVESCVILADSLSPADFRKLQIWLRWVVPAKPEAQRA